MHPFELTSSYKPTGDQPLAIKKLIKGLEQDKRYQTLLGVTGSGKTFTMANIIQEAQRPTLILSHNKTLAAQLCSEFQEFFPNNAVCYFVSYYDYYQPEAYIAKTDTYIEKDASINEEINKYRHAATKSLLTRRDVIIISSVSAIYGLGDVKNYNDLSIEVKMGESYKREKIMRHLADLQYTRSHLEFKQGMFHVLGEILEIFPPYGDNVIRLEFFGDELEKIVEADSFTGEILNEFTEIKIFPAKHNVTTKEKIEKALEDINKDLEIYIKKLKGMGKALEAERIQTRTEYDMEMLREVGYCTGIENYVRYFSSRSAGEQPITLLDYFPDDFLMFIDESHITVPQIGAMYEGNKSRKMNLVEHGFRLPSALDNRPLTFEEFEKHINNVMFISATPGKYEFSNTNKNIVEQIIRPTGLIDPKIDIRKTEHQIDDLLNEIKKVVDNKERVLITTITKKSAEDLSEFLTETANMKTKYLHSDIDTIERIEILRELRLGTIDIVVGINLLREGLDLPEVSLVVILDADKQGFLRSRDALIQTIGRAARNVNGKVIMYADRITDAMKAAIDETYRRRKIQTDYNKKHNITPQTIVKAVKDMRKGIKPQLKKFEKTRIPKGEIPRLIRELEEQMEIASQNLEFEKADEIKNQIEELEKSK